MGTASPRRSAASWPRSASARSSACPTASPLPSPLRCPPGGSAISSLLGRPVPDAASGNGAAPAAPAARMVSGRPHPALDRGLCRIDHDRGPADARHRRRNHHRRAAPRPVAHSAGRAMRHRRATSNVGSHALAHHRAGGRHDRRHDDADAQSLARRQDHGDIRPAASALARPEERGIAADDAGGAVASRWPSASPAGCSRCWRRSRPPR